MSNHDNHRRGESKRTEHGPQWEFGGSNNSAVARARRKWKRRANRKERRTGEVHPEVNLVARVRPSMDPDIFEETDP